ncbi:oxygenase MpaB family protein [Gordonia neofelifaecis]|uniref:ER-bound oxygenase mpaB/mpaB'/Rubber oxygenase catalytic domain-containing protein n=1 Tax=Gordonia neofelifaecis NRRL B-59395 TaxID=644548 RepID=F1YGT7_9ACTN|nr:oxygenase MpaB family protein [Gordonia neofelifaecis]EGD56235.1 hypothetical protein SCNU_05256 [Gordonia neofelifaecis NRRL B-59395]
MTAVVPARHPSAPRPIPSGVEVFSRLLRVDGPTAAQFAGLGESLMDGDPLMDAVVADLAGSGMAAGRAAFERAVENGIDSLEDPPAALRELFGVVEATPDWVDPARLRLAAQVMQSGGEDGLYIARDVALLGGYLFSGFNQTLLRTGALEKGSNTRFAETTRWALDVISEGGLAIGGAGYRSTLRVRFIHSLVRRHVAALPDWDSGVWGLPINQTDMAATLVGALVAPSVGVAGLGIVNSPREYEAIAHLTRYVGWLMGVDDDYLPTSFADAIRILNHTSAALAVPDDSSKLLAAPMADDPKHWQYPVLPGVRRSIARSQHLGIARAFLGRTSMRRLGLTDRAIPWYPPLVFPVNLIRSAAAQLPGGRARAARRGDRRAEAFMATMTGHEVVIGGAAIAHAS